MTSHVLAIRQCFDAYRRNDRDAIEALLPEGFTFTSPYDDAIDRATYFERCWPNADRIAGHVIERIVVDGDAAFVTYLARLVDGATFRNTEYFTFDADGRIATVSVYFGAGYDKDGTFVAQSSGKEPPG